MKQHKTLNSTYKVLYSAFGGSIILTDGFGELLARRLGLPDDFKEKHGWYYIDEMTDRADQRIFEAIELFYGNFYDYVSELFEYIPNGDYVNYAESNSIEECYCIYQNNKGRVSVVFESQVEWQSPIHVK
jgi:hypothetical protein